MPERMLDAEGAYVSRIEDLSFDRRTALIGAGGAVSAGTALHWSQSTTKIAQEAIEAATAKAAAPRFAQGQGDVGTIMIRQVPLGGGGFVTGIDVSTDGQRFVCRTDVANAYVRERNGSAWRPLFTPETMQASDYDPLPAQNGKADGLGVAGIRIAPSDKNVIYASFGGFIWKSLDGGRSIRRTRMKQAAMPANAGLQRLYNPIIDIHPRDPQRVIVGTRNDGVLFTRDGGAIWQQCQIPGSNKSLDDQPGINLVRYAIGGGDRIYVFVSGVGLFVSDGGERARFSLAEGGPLHCSDLAAEPGGNLILSEDNKAYSGKVWRFDPFSGWSSINAGHQIIAMALDPRNSKSLIVANGNSPIHASLDGGRSFKGVGWEWKAGEVAWTNDLVGMFPAGLVFDPLDSQQLFVAQGVGVARARRVGDQMVMTDWSAGIEELCVTSIIAPPGQPPIVSAWDKPFWRIETIDRYSNNFRYPLPKNGEQVAALVAFASGADFAADNPAALVGVVAPSDRTGPGVSVDGGKSWKTFETTPQTGWGHGGTIAMNRQGNIVLLPSNNGIGVFSLDGGSSWKPIMLDGANPTGQFSNAFYVNRKNLSADKTRPGTFALVYTALRNDSYDGPLGGIWITSDGGAGWRQTYKGVVWNGRIDPKTMWDSGADPRQFWQCQLEYVPGFPGELVYTPHADFRTDRLFWSKDDGASWSELHGRIRNVNCFGFGKASPGQSRPACYFWGEVSGKRGLYASFDWFRSEPQLLTRFPSQMLLAVSCVSGIPDVFGRVLVGTSCAGVVQIDLRR